MLYLLDTSTWIEFLKRPASNLGVRMENTPTESIATCSVVRAELLSGAQGYGNAARRIDLVNRTLATHRSLPFDDKAADRYAIIRHHLQSIGNVIGPYDLQIAAIAITHGLIVVTGNVSEFARVPGLRVENWSTNQA